MHDINLDDAKIKIDGKWLSTEDLAGKIEEKIQAGDMKFSHLAAALEELNKAVENSHIIEIKLVISNQDYEKLKALGGADDQAAVRKATLSFIEGTKQSEPSIPMEPAETAVQQTDSEMPPPAEDIEIPAEEVTTEELTVKEPDAQEVSDEKPDEGQATIQIVNCFKCKSPIDITTDKRPIDITCPNCDTTGRLDSSNKMEPRHQDHFLG